MLNSCQKETSEDTIFINFKRQASRLDPAFASNQSNIRLCSNVFQNLIGLNSNLETFPELASSYTIDESGRMYTFQLDSTITFSNGEPLTAEDVQYSFARILDESVASPGSWVLEPYLDSNWIEISSPYQFSIRLKEAFSPFIQLLSLPYCGIIQKGSDVGNTAIGSGPYVLENELTEEYLIFSRNSFYPFTNEGAPKQVVVTGISDGATEFLSFLDKKTDLILDLDNSISPLILEQGEVSEKFKDLLSIKKNAFLNVEYIGFNLQSKNCPKILLNQDFRRALAMAIPKQQFVETVLGNKGSPANAGMIPPFFKGFEESSYGIPYDLEEARRIIDSLKRNGIQQDAPISISVAATFAIWAETIQGFWKSIGIESIIDIQNNAMIRSKMRSSELHCFRASWIADYPSPENYASLFFGLNSAPPNYTRFQDSKVDKLYIQALKSENPTPYYQELDSLVVNSGQVIPIVYDEALWIVNPKLTQTKPDPMNRLFFEQIW